MNIFLGGKSYLLLRKLLCTVPSCDIYESNHLNMVRLLAVIGLASTLAVAGCGQLAQKERELLFRVNPGVASWYGGLPEGVEESFISVDAKGQTQRVKAWWLPAENPEAPTVLYLHGAKWNLTGQTSRIEQMHRFGFSVLAIDYRGFGDSDGDLPSETTVYEDAHAAWQKLVALQPDPAKRYIYGHSLGGAVAINLAADLRAANGPNGSDRLSRPDVPDMSGASKTDTSAHGLIVESTFTNLSDIARAFTYAWVPTEWILRQKFDSVKKIGQVGIPVLVVHGTEDRYVPMRFSETLFKAIPGKKELLLVPGANHNNSMRVGRSAYQQAMQDLFGFKSDPA